MNEEPFNGIKASDFQVAGKHYASMEIQPSEFIFRNGLGWLEGNAIKYVCRHSLKGKEVDLDKAIHYIKLIKEWKYNNNNEHSGCPKCGGPTTHDREVPPNPYVCEVCTNVKS